MPLEGTLIFLVLYYFFRMSNAFKANSFSFCKKRNIYTVPQKYQHSIILESIFVFFMHLKNFLVFFLRAAISFSCVLIFAFDFIELSSKRTPRIL